MTADAESKRIPHYTLFSGALVEAFDGSGAPHGEYVRSSYYRQLEADLARKAEEVAELKRGIEEDGKKVAKFLVEQTEQVASLRRELEAANERSKMMFDAKNHWADRAKTAEQDAAALREDLNWLFDFGGVQGEEELDGKIVYYFRLGGIEYRGDTWHEALRAARQANPEGKHDA